MWRRLPVLRVSPTNQYQEFLNAESCGHYFLSHIRDRFRFELA
jgi:hypothetical protein